jgi:hypothetical protein
MKSLGRGLRAFAGVTLYFMHTQELIDDFCQLPSRKMLYDEVATRSPVTLQPSHSTTWHSKTVAGQTTIWYSPTKHPNACLAHELLHARLKLSGYKQYVVSVCATEKSRRISSLLEILDNELQHHKFYPDFIALQFTPGEMYHDSDNAVDRELREIVAELRSDDPPENFLRAYVTIIAPGGAANPSEREQWGQLLQDKCPARYWKRLETIQQIISEYAHGNDLDAGPTLVRILKALGGYDPTWIGPSEDGFPDAGYFVGRHFQWERPDAPSRAEE